MKLKNCLKIYSKNILKEKQERIEVYTENYISRKDLNYLLLLYIVHYVEN